MDSRLTLRSTENVANTVQISLSNSDGFVLGRSDSRSSYVPDIDLANFSALEKGVSRRHAVFIRNQGKINILDLTSINGTFLNGKRLKPEVPYPIATGDNLGLGDLLFQVSLEQ